MRLEVTATQSLVFDDGRPVRAASAIVAYADGWLIAQDDSTHGALWRDGRVAPLRLLDPIDGLDWFSSTEGTKHLKPDLESACALPDGTIAVLGSGSIPARCRGLVLGVPLVEAEPTNVCATTSARSTGSVWLSRMP